MVSEIHQAVPEIPHSSWLHARSLRPHSARIKIAGPLTVTENRQDSRPGQPMSKNGDDIPIGIIGGVADITFDKYNAQKVIQIPLESGGEIIKDNYYVPLFEQQSENVRPKETCSTSNKSSHKESPFLIYSMNSYQIVTLKWNQILFFKCGLPHIK